MTKDLLKKFSLLFKDRPSKTRFFYYVYHVKTSDPDADRKFVGEILSNKDYFSVYRQAQVDFPPGEGEHIVVELPGKPIDDWLRPRKNREDRNWSGQGH